MQSIRFLAAVLVASVLLSATGCIRGRSESLGVTAAAGAGQVGSIAPRASRRQRISLRALGRMLEQAEAAATSRQPAVDSSTPGR